LSCFQYKLIHSVLALNPDLFKCKIKRNWTMFLFWECNVTKTFGFQ
jgi:hypothetical protein